MIDRPFTRLRYWWWLARLLRTATRGRSEPISFVRSLRTASFGAFDSRFDPYRRADGMWDFHLVEAPPEEYVKPGKRPRKAGALKGQIHVAPDFDTIPEGFEDPED